MKKEIERNPFLQMVVDRIHAGISPVQYTETEVREHWILMPDGVGLYGLSVQPKSEEKDRWPVVLMRNPYVWYEELETLIGTFFAEQGYAFIINRVRGTGKSKGEFEPFVHEREDGRAVIDWIAEQPWCDGNIATFGGSYLGHVQWCVSDYDHPALKTHFIQVYGGARPYHAFYRNGMFRQDIWTEWSCQMMGDHKESADEAYIQEQVRKGFEIVPQSELGEQLIGQECTWYKEWIVATSELDPYWSEGFWKEIDQAVEKITRPVFLQGGAV